MSETQFHFQQVVKDFSEQFRADYSMIGVLGRGTTALVVRAVQTSLRREVVIKILTSEEAEVRQRFLVEAGALGKLRHPNVVRLLDFGECGNRLYLVMEYLPGKSLATLLAEGTPGPALALDTALGVATGLEAIHSLDIIHRDLKPSNIWIGGENSVKILDFGLAREGRGSGITQEGFFLGTYSYAAPEQILGHMVDRRADIYTLGVLLYILLEGTNPFQGTTAQDSAQRHLRLRPADLDRSRSGAGNLVMDLALHLLAKQPAERPTAAAVVARLREIKESRSAPTAGRGLPMPPGEVTAPRPRSVAPVEKVGLPPRPSGPARALVIFITVLVLAVLGYALRSSGTGGAATGVEASASAAAARPAEALLEAARVLYARIQTHAERRETYKFRVADSLGPLGPEMNSGPTLEIILASVRDYQQIADFMRTGVEDELRAMSPEGAVLAALLRGERSSNFADLTGMKELLVIPREESLPADRDFQYFHRKIPAKQGTESLYLLRQAFGAITGALGPIASGPRAPPRFERVPIAVFDLGRRAISYPWTSDTQLRSEQEMKLFESRLSPEGVPDREATVRRLLLHSWRLSRQDQLSDESRRLRSEFHVVLEGIVASGFLERERAAPIVARIGR